PLVLGDDPETAALLDVERGEVEAVDVQDLAVDDHHLAVVADEIVGGARHGDPALQQLQFEFAEALGPASILMRGQRAHAYAANDSLFEIARDLHAIEPEDQDVDGLARASDCVDDRDDAGIRLDYKFHRRLPQESQQVARQLVNAGSTGGDA